ncbi:MAG: DNA polymerase III subunit gamma/tau [Fimbriimonadaceae bacterium]|nr:MAG: DNA polymerase III subunit gamma/tau [Fimbriimonadaceae bacterium]
MSYLALFRKYRSQSFEDLVGQDHVVRTLKNSITQGKIAQAYLFTGPRGTGKTSTARLLAKAVNCTGGPSGEIPADCPICAEITSGSCMDVIELDAASESGVQQVRDHIVEASEYQPAQCRYKVFIIDEVHDLSRQAFDALLKTIEEPPPHVIFILATTEFHKVPPTIRSRCQKFEFHRGSMQNLVSRLNYVIEQENLNAEPAAVTAIARLSDGGYRDALTLLEQAIVTADGKLTLEHVYDQLGLLNDEVTDSLILAMVEGNLEAIIGGLEEIYQRGRDPQSILESLMYRLADLTRALLQAGSNGNDAAMEAGLTAKASRIGAEKLLKIRSEISIRHKSVREVSIPRIWLEAECLKVALLLQESAPIPAPVQRPVMKEAKPVERVTSSPSAVAEVREPVAQKEAEPSPSVETESNQEPFEVEEVKTEEPQTQTATAGPEDEVWQRVSAEMCAKSPTAAIHLPGSVATGKDSGVVTVEFEKAVHSDWVTGKTALVKALRESWQAITGEEVMFKFISNGKVTRRTPKMEKASVESPLEGDRLADAAKRIFGTANEAPNDVS